ncbi:MAG: zinc finger MYND domain-containing protein [Bacteroidetes bacterium]|nr:zinc finger MYND domain-containing protein [Bacteroidota bacterium]
MKISIKIFVCICLFWKCTFEKNMNMNMNKKTKNLNATNLKNEKERSSGYIDQISEILKNYKINNKNSQKFLTKIKEIDPKQLIEEGKYSYFCVPSFLVKELKQNNIINEIYEENIKKNENSLINEINKKYYLKDLKILKSIREILSKEIWKNSFILFDKLTQEVKNNIKNECDFCNKKNNLKLCSCKRVKYCSEACQRKSWEKHKFNCINPPITNFKKFLKFYYNSNLDEFSQTTYQQPQQLVFCTETDFSIEKLKQILSTFDIKISKKKWQDIEQNQKQTTRSLSIIPQYAPLHYSEIIGENDLNNILFLKLLKIDYNLLRIMIAEPPILLEAYLQTIWIKFYLIVDEMPQYNTFKDIHFFYGKELFSPEWLFLSKSQNNNIKSGIFIKINKLKDFNIKIKTFKWNLYNLSILNNEKKIGLLMLQDGIGIYFEYLAGNSLPNKTHATIVK